MTTIIGISGPKNTGKSVLLKDLCKVLVGNPHNFTVTYTSDETGKLYDVVYILEGENRLGSPVRVAVCTCGDNQQIITNNLAEVKDHNEGSLPDYVVIACRVESNETDGYYTLVDTAMTHNYGWYAIRMSSLEPPFMNSYKVESLVNQILQ